MLHGPFEYSLLVSGPRHTFQVGGNEVAWHSLAPADTNLTGTRCPMKAELFTRGIDQG